MNIVFIHGLAASKSFFQKLEDGLLKIPSVSVLSFDLLGFGKNKNVGNTWSLDEHLEFITQEIENKFSGEEVCLVGHSMGGVLALTWALRNKNRVRKIVLLNTPLGRDSKDLRSAIGKSKHGWGYWILEHPMIACVSCFILCQANAMKLFSGFKPRFVGKEIFDDYRLHSWQSLKSSFENIIIKNPAMPLLENICGEIPIFRLIGTEDDEISRRPVKSSSVITKELQGGHYLPLERPVETFEAIKNFLNA